MHVYEKHIVHEHTDAHALTVLTKTTSSSCLMNEETELRYKLSYKSCPIISSRIP